MEVKLECKLIQIGNSTGVIIPPAILKLVDKTKGDNLKIKLVVDDNE
ncbi:MAG: hypothetical protein ACRCYA_05700 [Cetobacterium sp.]